MKALKIAATALLAAALLAAGTAAEALALANTTLLNPGFYGAGQRGAYEFVGGVVVRKLADAVLERTPAVALRTSDKRRAYALAAQALPPGSIADMLESSGPDIARYLISGGDMPVLRGSPEFTLGEQGLVKGLLMDGIWDSLPQKPSFPAFMPFTPEWNLGYGPALSQSLWLFRWYAGMAGQAFWMCLAAAVMLSGLLYLVWLRERRPFFAVAGSLFSFNGLVLLGLAAALSYGFRPIADASAAALPAAAGVFGGDFAELVRTALWPFRSIFFVSSLVSLSFGVTMFSMGVSSERPAAKPAWKGLARAAERSWRIRRRGPRHMRNRCETV